MSMTDKDIKATGAALVTIMEVSGEMSVLRDKVGKADDQGKAKGILASAFMAMLHDKDASAAAVDTECKRIIEAARAALKRDKLEPGDLPAAFKQYRSNIKRAIEMTADDLGARASLLKISHVNQYINGNAEGAAATCKHILDLIGKVREATASKGLTDGEKKALKVQRDTILAGFDRVLLKALKDCKAIADDKLNGKAQEKPAKGKKGKPAPIAEPTAEPGEVANLELDDDGTVRELGDLIPDAA